MFTYGPSVLKLSARQWHAPRVYGTALSRGEFRALLIANGSAYLLVMIAYKEYMVFTSFHVADPGSFDLAMYMAASTLTMTGKSLWVPYIARHYGPVGSPMIV